jgi:hypothetical protein
MHCPCSFDRFIGVHWHTRPCGRTGLTGLMKCSCRTVPSFTLRGSSGSGKGVGWGASGARESRRTVHQPSPALPGLLPPHVSGLQVGKTWIINYASGQHFHWLCGYSTVGAGKVATWGGGRGVQSRVYCAMAQLDITSAQLHGGSLNACGMHHASHQSLLLLDD